MRALGPFIPLLLTVLVGPLHAVGPRPALPPEPSLQPILAAQDRGNAWARALKEHGDFAIGRAALDSDLSIDDPEIYSARILVSKFEDWKKETPADIVAVITGNGALPREAPRGLARALGELRGIGMRASRWKMYLPRRAELIASASEDVRGLHALERLRNRAETLRSFSNLEDGERARLSTWLRQMCRNKNRNTAVCGAAFDVRLAKEDVNALYEELLPFARAQRDAHFAIPKSSRRADLKRSVENGHEIFELPFRDPENEAVWRFIRENVERAWRGPGWELRLRKIPVKDIGYFFGKPAYVEFKPGAVPLVTGGHRITLDANVPLTDPDAIRTLQHEFGHVLGFPDCYLEFFDLDARAIVNYQLDQSNIMCAKTGKVLPLHFERLREAYGKPR